MHQMRYLFFYLFIVVNFLFTPSSVANDLYPDDPEFELMDGDYDEIIHYDPLIFIDDSLQEKSKERLVHIVQEIKAFQKESKKVTIFIEGHTEPSTLLDDIKVTKSREYAQSVKEFIVENNVSNVEIIVSAQGDKKPYFTEILEDIKKLSNRVMVSLYMTTPQDGDGDGVYSDKDKCPFTKVGVYVGADGCAVRNIIALVAGKKEHSAIIVSTKKGEVVVDTPNSIVAIESADKAPTQPLLLNQQEIEHFFGDIAKESSIDKESKFTLFFDDVNLLENSQSELEKLFKTLRERKSLPYVQIIGHTDTKGSDAFNKALGLKRARLVRNIIINENIPLLKLDISSYGEANPLVKTADGVAEKLNRRVEIFIH